MEIKCAVVSSTLFTNAPLAALYRHLNLSHDSLAGEEKSDPRPRRRDLIEATKTFRGYKSPRDDKIGAARRAERHAACRARTHARGILMGSSSRATPHAEALDCHSRAAHFVFSKRKSDAGADTYRRFLTMDHYCLRGLKETSYSSFHFFYSLNLNQ